MNILTDYHHGGLYHSLHMLFERRLKFKLFRPVGLDWYINGFFKVAEPYGNAPDTINQYLGMDHINFDSNAYLNAIKQDKKDYYDIYDPDNNVHHKAITFDQFRQMEFDLIVATHPLHESWEMLLNYQPQAKFIMQIGNEGQTSSAKNILCSTADFVPKPGQNIVRYHQEFDLSDHEYTVPENHNKIKSFVIGLPEPETYEMYKNALPDFEFKAYGVGSPDGTVPGGYIPRMMRESAFGYHIKPLDGYGHVIHKWAFSGRPLITKASYYKNKLAEPLLIDGVTCIDLDRHTFEENLNLIKQASIPENHIKMCENMAKRAREVVSFDRDSEKVKEFISSII